MAALRLAMAPIISRVTLHRKRVPEWCGIGGLPVFLRAASPRHIGCVDRLEAALAVGNDVARLNPP